MKKILLEKLLDNCKEQEYQKQYEYIINLLEEKKIKPVKASRLNGKSPALYREYWYFVPGTVVCALAGSVIGANLALIISDEILKTVLVVLLPIVAFCVLRDKNLEVIVPEGMTRRKQYIIAAACSLGIGIYDGFYGPGTGTFLLLAFTKLAKMDLEKSTGNVKAVNLASNISALITFILAGKILWTLGLAASCFSIAGHYTGAGMVMHNGVKIIKPIILVVLVLLLIKVISGM